MSVNAPTRTRRRWQQLSLRAILLLMLVAALVIWALSPATPDEVLIQGQWDIVSATVPKNNNKPIPYFLESGYEFRGSTAISLSENDALFDLKLFPEQCRLKAYLIHEGKVHDSLYHNGFYYLNGDTLKLCYCSHQDPKTFRWGVRGEFPQECASKTYVLIEMKRRQR